ncbi:hypothetical protein F5887DRAFT_196901 [Amanita rubescens]|nr:hypothetical protein F5887DRAFT_196901 [Amanita rubescens]
MSRHRHVRNINIHDELDDDALSDGGDHDMSPEQQAEMEAGLESVRAVIGNLDTSGLSDTTLRDVLWEYYFDIGRTIQWAIDEQERRRRAEERKEDDKGLPPLPQDAEETPVYHQYPQPWLQFGEERPRVPLILLAQQQQQLMEEQRAHQEYMQEQDAQEEESVPSEYAQYPPAKRPLTPIPEITEGRSSKISLIRSSSSTVTSYGRTIERDETYSQADTIKDPNRIPVSPSPSAVLQLANMESTSNRSDTASTLSTPRQPVKSVETLPSLNKIPDIPDSNSKTSTQPEPQADVKPKLLTMALSTASSVASQSGSSRSTGTLRSGSVKTYPLLRPTAESLPPPSTVAPSHHDGGSSTISSAASSQVRRAIQAALDQEARDRAAARNRPLPITPDTSRAPSSVASKTEMPKPEGSVSSPKQEPQKLSKLAMLAQARAGKAEPPKASNPPVIKTDPAITKAGGLASPQSKESHLSKLAMLAQAKIDPSKRPKLPKTTTEYLTPIANGPTVTTAITTSYQSLYSLTDPSQVFGFTQA